MTGSPYLDSEGWRVHPITGENTPPDGWVSKPLGGGPVEPAAPREPEPPPKPRLTREERAAAVRAQAAAIKAAATPEELAEVEARLAAQDALAHPVRPLPAVAEGGDA